MLVVFKDNISDELNEIVIKSENEFHQIVERLLKDHYKAILPEYESDSAPLIIREFNTPSGRIDFLALDPASGRIYLIEVKKEDNYRVATSQLLDYVAALKNMPVNELVRAFSAKIGNYENIVKILEKTEFALVAILPEIGDGFRALIDYLNDAGIRIYGIEIKRYKPQNSNEIISINTYPDPEKPRISKKFIKVPSEVDDAMKLICKLAESRGAKELVYYKTSADLRLRKEGHNIVLARIRYRKRDNSLVFALSCRDNTGHLVLCFKITIGVNEILKKTEKLDELLTKIKQAYDSLYQ